MVKIEGLDGEGGRSETTSMVFAVLQAVPGLKDIIMKHEVLPEPDQEGRTNVHSTTPFLRTPEY